MPAYRPQDESDGQSLVRERVREPERFAVLLHNDDYTSMEFVVEILQEIFHKDNAEATRIMLSVHERGLGRCGVYTAEIAEAKVRRVTQKARAAGFPLRCTMEPE
ncbi:ATP-dependent Clp protease adapter ClpS [uncultured Desulfovibrio sp.]|uniref:ATP-dependent Clp protease adapter protein ClpS n=1 Tax=Candidatus Desulfovibrio intestinavium TaxID=2838534 RepID=A0A9D2KS84_9BACT|nr:ATP-dependent Clp protease adapter ClpS [uncultured Desulfovibrio sp.]HJA79171.1 ATP-dependent Clp protease adapter ClpS [Candidatus Desulfovibrio intestinavium]